MVLKRYLKKLETEAGLEAGLPAPRPGLRLCVVIPALAERDGIGRVIDSLGKSARLAEVIVVVNNPADAADDIVRDNLLTIDDLRKMHGKDFPLLAVDRASPGRAFSSREAGVGMARRVGMDLALRRLVAAGTAGQGAIACLDADSPVAPGYIDALLEVFDSPRAPLAGLCSYRHPLPEDEPSARAIVAYELWLRYVELGMLLAGSACAFQAVGSCIVASCRGYALADGMPRRKAGEDFHFLQKVAKVGGPGSVVRIPGATVFPAARQSSRVPFGTGRAMRRMLEEGPREYLWVEPCEAFCDLRGFYSSAGRGFDDIDSWLTDIGPELADFIRERRGPETLRRLRANFSDADHFAHAVQTWFDGLQAIRYARRRKAEAGPSWIFSAISRALGELSMQELTADLKHPDPADDDLDLQLKWLERLRLG
ncbi:MAG TPA: glycosyltransferase family A protein [Myxococcota bacterium]|nr:glycosyltransferase family A protein [Myxococcota bacterium]